MTGELAASDNRLTTEQGHVVLAYGFHQVRWGPSVPCRRRASVIGVLCYPIF